MEGKDLKNENPHQQPSQGEETARAPEAVQPPPAPSRVRVALVGAGEKLKGATTWMLRSVSSTRARRALVGLAVVGGLGYAVSHAPSYVYSVAPGEVGVRVNLLTGKTEELREGWVVMVPNVHRLHKYTLKDQTFRPAKSQR
ncbi:MAG TPA: hypothetical protein VK447_00170, partial [Myxococcaceae bacterium]|nr:hypothetical protein [Myxococcaceae bacterium]